MKIQAALARIPPRLAFWALAGVALLVSHDAIFLLQMGPGEALTRALRESGHDYWGSASLALVAIGLATAVGAWIRLRGLGRKAAELGAARGTTHRIRLLPTWLRIFAIVVIGFVVQENIEHYVSHMHATGLGALLGPEYPLALPVIAIITAFAAFLATAVGGAERELLAAIAAALRHDFGRAPCGHPRQSQRPSVARISPIALAIAGRAPPRAFVSHD